MLKGKRNALGRGLDSLISIDEVRTDGSTAISEIDIDRISPNPEQPRFSFDAESLDELAASIAEIGVIQPLSLRKTDAGDYQLIAGERRWRAARMAGLRSVPAYVRTASDLEITEMALIENIQREDLNAIEVALAFNKLIESYHLTQERLSERIGKKRSTVSNHLRLLKLPAEIQLGLRDRRLDMGHARALLSVADPKLQLRLYNRILKEGLSVRRVEELAKEINEGGDEGDSPRQGRQAVPARVEAWQRQIQNVMPAPVKLNRKPDGKGTITLKFDNDEELQQLVALFERLK